MTDKRLEGGPPKQQSGPGVELATRQPFEAWHDAEWQRLWLAVEARPWRTLALIPAAHGAALDFTLFIAITLSRTGMVHLGSPVQVADATEVPLSQLTAFLSEVRRSTSDGARLLVALPPADKSAISVSIAQSSDAALLCVLLERMTSAEAKRTLRLVGPSRFIGSAIFHPSQIRTRRK